MPDRPTCASCRWFDHHPGYEQIGLCRVLPPRFMPSSILGRLDGTDKLRGMWPLVATDDWCREHTPHVPETTAPQWTLGVHGDAVQIWVERLDRSPWVKVTFAPITTPTPEAP